MLQTFMKKWSGWVGDREMEIAMRAAMTKKGWRGKSAKFSRVRLVAIQRPGWLQVYAFDAECKSRDENSEDLTRVFGVVRQDERYNKVDIECFESAAIRNSVQNKWSDGLHQLRR